MYNKNEKCYIQTAITQRECFFAEKLSKYRLLYSLSVCPSLILSQCFAESSHTYIKMWEQINITSIWPWRNLIYPIASNKTEAVSVCKNKKNTFAQLTQNPKLSFRSFFNAKRRAYIGECEKTNKGAKKGQFLAKGNSAFYGLYSYKNHLMQISPFCSSICVGDGDEQEENFSN